MNENNYLFFGIDFVFFQVKDFVIIKIIRQLQEEVGRKVGFFVYIISIIFEEGNWIELFYGLE